MFALLAQKFEMGNATVTICHTGTQNLKTYTKQADILSQILIETITLTGFGALIGVTLGVCITFLISSNSALPAAIDWKWIVLSITLGILVGVGSGIYPASQAAKLPPVDALRAE